MSKSPEKSLIPLPAAAGLTAMLGLLPARAWAHVKWFEPYDVTQSPAPIRGVMTTHFILVLAGFALLMVGGFMLDRLAARSGWRLAGPQRRETAEEKVLRAGIGAFFATAIGVLFAAYYGLQHAEYRSGAIAWQATLVAPAETR